MHPFLLVPPPPPPPPLPLPHPHTQLNPNIHPYTLPPHTLTQTVVSGEPAEGGGCVWCVGGTLWGENAHCGERPLSSEWWSATYGRVFSATSRTCGKSLRGRILRNVTEECLSVELPITWVLWSYSESVERDGMFNLNSRFWQFHPLFIRYLILYALTAKSKFTLIIHCTSMMLFCPVLTSQEA